MNTPATPKDEAPPKMDDVLKRMLSMPPAPLKKQTPVPKAGRKTKS